MKMNTLEEYYADQADQIDELIAHNDFVTASRRAVFLRDQCDDEGWFWVFEALFAYCERKQGNLEKAKSIYLEVLEHSPKHKMIKPLVYKDLGYIYGQEGELQKAIECYDNCIDVYWGKYDFMVNYAVNLYEMGNLKDAVEILKSAEGFFPADQTIIGYLNKIRCGI